MQDENLMKMSQIATPPLMDTHMANILICCLLDHFRINHIATTTKTALPNSISGIRQGGFYLLSEPAFPQKAGYFFFFGGCGGCFFTSSLLEKTASSTFP